jgi:hypothetical protein
MMSLSRLLFDSFVEAGGKTGSCHQLEVSEEKPNFFL